MASVALVAAVNAGLCLNGSFGHRRGTAPDPERPVRVSAGTGRFSAEAAAGDLADHFRYEVVTEHRLVNPANGSFLIFYAAGPAIDSRSLRLPLPDFCRVFLRNFPLKTLSRFCATQ